MTDIDREIAEALGWDEVVQGYWRRPDDTAATSLDFSISIDAQVRYVDPVVGDRCRWFAPTGVFCEKIEPEEDGYWCILYGDMRVRDLPEGTGPTKAHARAAALLEALRRMK